MIPPNIFNLVDAVAHQTRSVIVQPSVPVRKVTLGLVILVLIMSQRMIRKK